jgi:anaerobic selenocysteine-containing dehydrogenase
LIRFGALPPKHELSEQGHRRHRHAIPSCLGENLLYINRTSGERLGIADDDWVKVTSAYSTITVQAKLMDGMN